MRLLVTVTLARPEPQPHPICTPSPALSYTVSCSNVLFVLPSAIWIPTPLAQYRLWLANSDPLPSDAFATPSRRLSPDERLPWISFLTRRVPAIGLPSPRW